MKKTQNFMKSVMLLMVSQFIIKIAGLIYKIYITNRNGFGDTGNAIFAAGFQVYALLLAISSIGVPNAISQLVSKEVAIGNNKGAHRIFKIAISIFGLTGFTASCILFLCAKTIAIKYLGIPESEMIIVSLAPSIFAVSISSVLKGYFNAIEKISITANSQSIEQILKTILTIIAVEVFAKLSSNDTVSMVSGAAIATTMATFFSFIYLYSKYLKNKKEIWKDIMLSYPVEKEKVGKIVRRILNVSIPIAMTALLAASNRTIDAFSVVKITSEFLGLEQAKFQYGILTGKVESLVVLPYSFNIAFATTLVPTISAAQAKGEINKAERRIKFSILATILITLPCTAIFVLFGDKILKLLFPNAYLGKTMLQLSSLSIVFVAINQTIGGVMQGINKLKVPIIAIAIGTIVKLILNMVLVPIKNININGAIIATVISHFVTFMVSFIYLKKYVNIKFNLNKFILKPITATICMSSAIKFVDKNYLFLNSQNFTFIFAILIGIFTYLLAIIFLKTLSNEEMNMLPYGNKVLKKIAKTSDQND